MPRSCVARLDQFVKTVVVAVAAAAVGKVGEGGYMGNYCNDAQSSWYVR